MKRPKCPYNTKFRATQSESMYLEIKVSLRVRGHSGWCDLLTWILTLKGISFEGEMITVRS